MIYLNSQILSKFPCTELFSCVHNVSVSFAKNLCWGFLIIYVFTVLGAFQLKIAAFLAV